MASERKATHRIKRASKVFGVSNAVDGFSGGNARRAAHFLLAWTRIKLNPIGLFKLRHGLLVWWSMLSESACVWASYFQLVQCSAVVEEGVPCVRAGCWKWEQFSLAVKHVESTRDERPLHNGCRTNKQRKIQRGTSRGTNLQRTQWENTFMKRFRHYTPSDKV